MIIGIVLILEFLCISVFRVELVSNAETLFVRYIALFCNELVRPMFYFTAGLLIGGILQAFVQIPYFSKTWLRIFLRIILLLPAVFIIYIILAMWIPMPHILPDLTVMGTYVAFSKMLHELTGILLVAALGTATYLLYRKPI